MMNVTRLLFSYCFEQVFHKHNLHKLKSMCTFIIKWQTATVNMHFVSRDEHQSIAKCLTKHYETANENVHP